MSSSSATPSVEDSFELHHPYIRERLAIAQGQQPDQLVSVDSTQSIQRLDEISHDASSGMVLHDLM
jgi:hypothetical protein